MKTFSKYVDRISILLFLILFVLGCAEDPDIYLRAIPSDSVSPGETITVTVNGASDSELRWYEDRSRQYRCNHQTRCDFLSDRTKEMHVYVTSVPENQRGGILEEISGGISWLWSGNPKNVQEKITLNWVEEETVTVTSTTTTTMAFHTQAVDFDGSSEYLMNATSQSIGISNEWTISIWLQADSFNDTARILEIRNGTTDLDNWIAIMSSSGKLRTVIKDSFAFDIKNYIGNTTLGSNTAHIVVTWDGTNLKMYQNSIEDTPYTKNSDSSSTMVDSNRQILVGQEFTFDPSRYFDGKIHSIAMWNSALSGSAITSIYDSGGGYLLDLRESYQNYTKTVNLAHYWPLGKTSTDIGKDYVSSGIIDIDTDAININSSDIVNF
ncbi:MAG: LamG domain-containing protein [SAR324 cluster bacterium]|nr:LamG domain-containing protein [SAR324 cluster bacterium]